MNKLGRMGLAAAGLLGLLALPGHAQAASKFKCCVYLLPDSNTFHHCVQGNCPKEAGGYPLVDRFFVSNCLDCIGPN